MSPKNDETDGSYRARIPADVETPDKIVYGLTARQLAILSLAALAGYLLTSAVGHLLPAPILIALLTPLAGAAIVLALGRRDGLPLDAWLLAGIRHSRGAHHFAPAPTGAVALPPQWAPASAQPSPLAVLRLPARSIAPSGVIDVGPHAAALVAATTVNIGLRTAQEQAALIDAYGRWLNSLSGPVQVVVSTQRVDLSRHARRVTDQAGAIRHPALAAAARDYGAFLHELAASREPLWRTVTIAVTAAGEVGRESEVGRRAEQAASALAALGAQTAVLDGERATGVLAATVDPYAQAGITGPRSRPDAVITSNGARP